MCVLYRFDFERCTFIKDPQRSSVLTNMTGLNFESYIQASPLRVFFWCHKNALNLLDGRLFFWPGYHTFDFIDLERLTCRHRRPPQDSTGGVRPYKSSAMPACTDRDCRCRSIWGTDRAAGGKKRRPGIATAPGGTCSDKSRSSCRFLRPTLQFQTKNDANLWKPLTLSTASPRFPHTHTNTLTLTHTHSREIKSIKVELRRMKD